MGVKRKTRCLGELKDPQQCTTSTKMLGGVGMVSWKTRVTLIDQTEFEFPKFKK